MIYIFIIRFQRLIEQFNSSFHARMDTDVIKLIESKHEVTLLGSNLNEFCVKFYGPRGEFDGGEGVKSGHCLF